MRDLRNNRRGQALVESALILVIFVFVLTGIADFGHFLYIHQSLTERVRIASRYGAVKTYSDGVTIRNVAVYNTPTPAEGATPVLPGLTTDLVTATLVDSNTDAARINVQITNYPFSFISPYMATGTVLKAISATAPYEIP